MSRSLPNFHSSPNLFQNSIQVLPLPEIITNGPPDPCLAPKPLFGLSFHAPKILRLPPKLYHAISNIIPAMPLENHPKILLLPPYLNFFLFELNDKTFISFLYCVFVCERHRSRCERGRTRRRSVLQASKRGPVL